MENRMFIKRSLHVWITLSFMLLIVPFISAQTGVNQSDDWSELIMQRIRDRHKAVNVNQTDNTYTKYYLSILNEDGSFPDIDYNNNAQTNWNPLAHLDRMKYMVLSYTIPASQYYGSDLLYSKIQKMFEFWYNKHPLSSNWYNQQIACPQRVGVMLILMRSGNKQLPKELEHKLLERMRTEGGRPDQSGSQGTGANKLDIATHWVYRGCLTQDEAVLSFGAEQVYYPLFLTTGEGLQHDYSYQQHGNQIHIGAYGFVFVDGISSIAAYMTGTPYEMSQEKLNYLSRFVREAYVPTIRGQHFMFNVLGRAISRKGALSQSGFHTVLNCLKEMDVANSNEYDNAIARIKAVEGSSYELKPFNRHFWRSDYMLHQRSAYTFDVRGASIYSCKNENGNNESLKGYFLADGATELTLTGTEFVNIFSVWDWTRIPGTTTPVRSSIPVPSQWQKPGTSKFSGSASNGKYGVTTYLYNDPNYSINTSANKAWFMFDDEIVCLGAGIKSTASEQINTTVNQCLLDGEVWIKRANETESNLNKGLTNYTDLSWIYHNNVGYVFPNKADINVSNNTQSGKWSAINSSQSADIESKDVFKVWFNHGAKPVNNSYEYILLPNKTLTGVKNYSLDNVEILANNDMVQAVKHNTLDILGVVFYKAATFKHEDIEVTVDKPCVVMFTNISTSEIETYISDPSRTVSNIKLVTSFPGIVGQKELLCSFPIHPNPYAGATVQYIINEATPKYIPEAEVEYDTLVVVQDAWVRDGDFASQNVGGKTNTLVLKKDNAGYNREVYLKFDLSTIRPDLYTKYLLKLSVSNSNTSINETQWAVSAVSDNAWLEESITWNNSPKLDYLIATVSPVAAGSDLIIDLTSVVTDELSKGNKYLSLHIASTQRGSDGKTDVQFFSKESSNPENSPMLLLQLKNEADIADLLKVRTTADAWVRDGSDYQNTNYGNDKILIVKKDNVGYNREAYLKFDFTTINIGSIQNAKLKLRVQRANVSVPQIYWGIYAAKTNWEESSIVYSNRPVDVSELIASVAGQEENTDVFFDVSDYIRSEYEKGNKIFSFHVIALGKTADGKSDAAFYSGKADIADNRPELWLETIPYSSLRTETISIEQDDHQIALDGKILQMETPDDFRISVLDLSGRVIKLNKKLPLNVSDLNSGVYIFKFQNDEKKEIFYKKYIIK